MREGNNILNVESLLSSDVVTQNMRFEFSPEDVAFNDELKSGEVSAFEQISDKLDEGMDTWLSASSSRSDES